MASVKELVIRDLLVTYVQSGDEVGTETVIFLHGWRSSKEAWSRIGEAITPLGYQIYALDLPGFGNSQAPRDAYDVTLYAGLLREFMKKLGIQKAVIIGHSFGGRIGIVLAAKHPELVSKLVLVDSAGIRASQMRRDALRAVAKAVKPLFTPAFMQPLRRSLYLMLGAEDYLATPELRETFVKTVNEDLTPYLSRITVNTLLLWGENDKDTPVHDAERMMSLIPNARLVVIPAAGHFSFLDAPDTFIKELHSFLKS